MNKVNYSPQEKAKYLRAVIKTARSWLSKEEAANERKYLLERLPEKHHGLFRFGYLPNEKESIEHFIEDFRKELKPNEMPEEILQNLKIFFFRKRKINKFFESHKLIIPYYDVYGKPISIVGRTILPEAELKERKISKYKNLPFNRRRHLFGLNYSLSNIIEKDQAIILEGQFDFITSFVRGLKNCCSLCGSGLCFEHIVLLKRFTNNFIILSDMDDAADKSWERIKEFPERFDISLKRVVLPDKSYKDIDLFLRKTPLFDPNRLIINTK